MKLTELFSLEELELEVTGGYVKRQLHPFLPLDILNYTDKATYDQRWNSVTTHCRGLIVDRTTMEVIARGPKKFWNYGEPSAPEYPLDTLVRVTRKEDGSLGIIWDYMDEEADEYHYGYATRGSFTSEQAIHATKNMHEVVPDGISQWQERQHTAIDEIIFPENRIVLDYADRDENIPLGVVNNRTGLIEWRPSSVLVEGQPAIMTLAEAIAMPIPDDEEGYVLDILDEYLNVIDHLKLKGDKYKELHSAIFGLTERKIYDAWIAGTEPELIEGLPDELQSWAISVAQRFDDEWDDLMGTVRASFGMIPQGERKYQAKYILVNHKEIAPALFALLDDNVGKCHAWVDKQLKPGHVPFRVEKETVSQ